MIEFTVPGPPVTKKNSLRLVRNPKTGGVIPIPSAQFQRYQERAGYYLTHKRALLDGRYNVRCVYYMPTRRRVDLANLLEATCDILTHYGVLKDDNSDIVASHDGSHVRYDKEHPRVEIALEEVTP